ncbi:MAG: SpoIID/LytB domain-containing protein [Candidatus Amulumruptor caecigallinarius]|nr:SpoIID/LytB domain-containing protein [Candidatus Amulumruptor caecigallinarius]
MKCPDSEIMIRVGLITDGAPEFRRNGNLVHLQNLLIGADFHWQRVIEAAFEGEIEYIEPQGNIRAVNVLPLERYLVSVTGSEMSPRSPLEFLKAHAVISRSWALRKIRGESDEANERHLAGNGRYVNWDESDCHAGFHVCSDDHCQRYQGVGAKIPEACAAAVAATAGEVLLDEDGNVADARFSKCCGGVTEIFSSCWADRDYPYLKSFADPYCNLSDMRPEARKSLLGSILKSYDLTDNALYSWEKTVSKSEIKRHLREKFGMDIGEVQNVTPMLRGPSGRITLMRISGTTGSVEIGKELMIRRVLDATHLPSSCFEAEERGEMVHLSGQGWGHGVGLCQTGAARMAAEGASYRDILGFYYPGTTIGKI